MGKPGRPRAPGKARALHTVLRAALRQVWLRSAPRREVLRAARAMPRFYFCADCKFPTDKPTVDHREPVGPTPGSKLADGVTWDGFIARLFCQADGLQVLCLACHQAKTLRDALDKRPRAVAQ